MKKRIALFIFLNMIVIWAGCSSPEAQPGNIVIFSTDYGLGLLNGATNGPDSHAADVDDAYAVTLALGAALDVQGIITTFGNDKARPSFESVSRGLLALGYGSGNVRVGSEGFLDALPVTFEPAGQKPPVFCVNTGVETMRSILDQAPGGTVTIFALGPFTDIACLRRAYPSSYNKLKEIIGLVGSRNGRPVLEGHQVTDFNFAMDPTALGLVIQNSTVSITFIMFEVSQLGTLSNQVLNTWATSGTPAQKYYGQASIPHAKYWDAIFTRTDGQALFDAHTVYYFLNPGLYTCEDNMLATANIQNYPSTDASTTNNTLAVESRSGSKSKTASAGVTFSGAVRGCYGFKSSDSVQTFELAVQNSVKPPS